MATILYVEDHQPAQLLMQALIAELTDHTLLMAGTAAEALRIVKTTYPDLYILDLDLPDSTGVELALQLKKINSAPIILISAYAESIRITALADLIAAYIAKPLDPENVTEIIQRTLAR